MSTLLPFLSKRSAPGTGSTRTSSPQSTTMMMKLPCLILLFSWLSTGAVGVVIAGGEPAAMPVFLFAGQSNMEGVAGQPGNIYFDETGQEGLSLNSLVSILNSNNIPWWRKQSRLSQEIQKVPEEVRDQNVAVLEANELLDLQSRFPNLFSNIPYPLSDVYCSWTRPLEPPTSTPLDDNATNLSPEAECGSPWGGELSFGHTFQMYNEFAIAKVASGGTEIYKNWTRVPGTDYGNSWMALQNRIWQLSAVHPTCAQPNLGGPSCAWQGLVYFQGENDCFEEDNAMGYGGNLTNLIAYTRQEMYNAGANPTYRSPNDIPVVIVQLGCWPERDLPYGPYIMAAQEEFVRQATNAALVTTSDLSCFYHMDDAALLIIGDRIARAMESLLISN